MRPCLLFNGQEGTVGNAKVQIYAFAAERRHEYVGHASDDEWHIDALMKMTMLMMLTDLRRVLGMRRERGWDGKVRKRTFS